jgi:hypothetical protein
MLAFCTAKAGTAIGTRKRNPEIARSARIVPELNFVTYAFVSVFNIFKPAGPNRVFKLSGQMVYFGGILPFRHQRGGLFGLSGQKMCLL